MYFLFQPLFDIYNNYNLDQRHALIDLNNKKLIKENNDLKYKLEGAKLAKDEIYQKYQLLIINKSIYIK